MTSVPWWRWTLATVVILAGWLYFGALISAGFSGLGPHDGWFQLLRELAPFIPFFLATPIVWRFLIGRPVRELVDERGRIEGKRILVGFGVWLVLSAASTALDALVNPGDYRFTFDATRFLSFAVVVILLLPVQTWAEELFFRGWVLRWASGLPPVSRVFISGLVFALPHSGNPEAKTDTLLALCAYFLLGAGWAWVSVRDGGIEAAMGAHLANNAFSLLIVGYDDAVLPTSAVYTTTSLNLTTTVLSLLFMVPVFVLATRRRHADR